MEIWALEAYGASHVLQEILTYKSDDVVGRVKVYESIVKGTPLPNPGIPEAFRVLIKEFQALGLDISVINNNDEVIGFKELESTDEDEDDTPLIEEVSNTRNKSNDEEEFDDIDDLDDELEDEFEDIEDEEMFGDDDSDLSDEDEYEDLEEIDEDFEEIDEEDKEIGGEF